MFAAGFPRPGAATPLALDASHGSTSMARVLDRPPSSKSQPADPPPVRSGLRGRGQERALLLWNLPLAMLAAWGVAMAQSHPAELFPTALLATGGLWAACFGLHLLLCFTRFDGDLLILPLLSALLIIGSAFHLDLRGPATPGLTPEAYSTAALVGLGVLALITAGGRGFQRLNRLLEERVWWPLVGARPYYASVPFHLLLLGSMGLLLVLLKLGGVRGEGGALVQVPLPGGFSFTPSELIRLAVAFFLADYLGRNSRALRNLRQPVARVWPLSLLRLERRAELGIVLLTVGLYCAFFYLFHDFGPAVVIIVLTLTALYAATGRLLTPLALGGALGAAIGFTVWKDLGFHTLRNRVEMWLDPWHTYFTHGDHLARILWGISAGGWFGLGVGSQDLARQIPLARNDAAFAGLAASMGLWTAVGVLAIFAAITWRGMLAARQAPTDRTRLLAFCLTSLLAFQAVWIAGAMVRVFPFTGINLPFISTGLSNMIASALALGTIWNISRMGGARNAAPVTDATEATPEVLAGITRLAKPVTALFALPAIGVILYGCPWLLGDRTLETTAYGVGRGGERAAFSNPYLEQFRRRFQRGRIFSADGRLLAFSDPSQEELTALRADAPNFAAYVAERLRAGGTEGERFYPLGSTTAQLVGWTPHGDFMAREGSVETSFDGVLRGYNPHQLPFYFRTRNNPLVRPPEAQDLQLTIVADLQRFARERLARAVKDARGSGGALVVYDVATGAVLAAATAPTFDPNGLNTERMQTYVKRDPSTRILTNKALSRDALYFPGSTFKVLTAGAGIEEGITGSVTCRNGRNAEPITWEYGGTHWRRKAGQISDYSQGSHGTLGLDQGMDHALAVSCNVFFGELAAKLGPERLHRAMKAAELSKVPDERELAEHLPYAGFGQIVVKTSPLEMAMLAAAAGAARTEGGDHPVPAARPHWVQAVVNRSGKREPEGVFGAPDRRPYRPFSEAAAQRLRKMMVGVVEDPSGTAHAAFYRGGERRLPGITVGGKTGTAEFDKITTDARSGRKRTVTGRHAWFIGFARSDHELEPRTLAFAVLVEDVRRGGTGGTICAPVARDLIAHVLPAPGASTPLPFQGLERFYQQQVRPRLGPFAGVVDWLRVRFAPH